MKVLLILEQFLHCMVPSWDSSAYTTYREPPPFPENHSHVFCYGNSFSVSFHFRVPASEMALPTAEIYVITWVTPFLSSAAVLKSLLMGDHWWILARALRTTVYQDEASNSFFPVLQFQGFYRLLEVLLHWLTLTYALNNFVINFGQELKKLEVKIIN